MITAVMDWCHAAVMDWCSGYHGRHGLVYRSDWRLLSAKQAKRRTNFRAFTAAVASAAQQGLPARRRANADLMEEGFECRHTIATHVQHQPPEPRLIRLDPRFRWVEGS